MKEREVTSLEQLLDAIASTTADRDQVRFGDIVDAVGHRSFGPVVVVAGIIVLAPLIGDLPGVPTLMGLLVLLTTGQAIFRREHLWLPAWLANRQVPRDKLVRGLGWLHRPARWLDYITSPRLTPLVEGAGWYLMAGACALVALLLPAMEVVPFSANGGGLALVAFGLAMIARDGVIALFALTVSGATVAVIVWALL